jgi:GT2 family glycosyltransferase
MRTPAVFPAPLEPGSTPKVAVIVLNWNGRDLTLDCLDSLLKSTYPNLEAWLVDNASSDGSAEVVEKKYGGRVKILVNDSNLGFAGGNNAGIDRVLAEGADYVLLLNNDTVVDPCMVGHLAGLLDNQPEAGIAGPKIYYYSPPDQIWFAGGKVFLARATARHIGIREKDSGRYDTLKETDYITGCALMARREVFEKIGRLDPVYMAYFEDTDFCMRARLAGFKIYYVPTGKVWHKISASTGGQLGALKIKRKLRSTRIFFGRYARPWHWLTIPFYFLADVIRIGFLVGFGRIKDDSGAGPNQDPVGGSHKENS